MMLLDINAHLMTQCHHISWYVAANFTETNLQGLSDILYQNQKVVEVYILSGFPFTSEIAPIVTRQNIYESISY